MILSTSRTYYRHKTNSQNEMEYLSKDGQSLQIFQSLHLILPHYPHYLQNRYIGNYVFSYPVQFIQNIISHTMIYICYLTIRYLFVSLICITPKNHTGKRGIQEDLQVRNCTIENDLKELVGTTYTSKMHLLFCSPSLNNSTIKHVWL